MIPAHTIPRTDVVFTHVLPDGSNVVIHVDALLRGVDRCKALLPVEWLPTDADMAKRFIRDNIVNPARCTKLKRKLVKSDHFEPLIFCKDGTFADNGAPNVFFVDGHHRYTVATLSFAAPLVPIRVLSESFWRPYQVEGCKDITPEQLKSIPTTRIKETL